MICPNCKIGNLVMRKGKYGPFYGCSQYPKCAYVERIKEQKDKLELEADKLLKNSGRADLIL